MTVISLGGMIPLLVLVSTPYYDLGISKARTLNTDQKLECLHEGPNLDAYKRFASGGGCQPSTLSKSLRHAHSFSRSSMLMTAQNPMRKPISSS